MRAGVIITHKAEMSMLDFYHFHAIISREIYKQTSRERPCENVGEIPVIKAIFFDVDGTLVPSGSNTIQPDTMAALRHLRAEGVRLFLSTGRHMTMLDQVREQFDFDGYITVSGQFCTCAGQVVYKNPIPRSGMEELAAAMEREGFSGMFLEGESCWLNACDEAAEAFLTEFHVARPPVLSLSRALEGEVYQVIVMLGREREHLLLDHAPHLAATRWHPGFLDAMPPGGGKDTGIGRVLEHLGLSRQQAMAFGDGENDISMLRCVGTGVAMGNANDTVKAAADYITAGVEEGGLCAALTYYGLL